MNNKLIPVDFNNRDVNGSVRLNTNGTLNFVEVENIHLTEGLQITMTDGELYAEGSVFKKDAIWHSTIDKWLDYTDVEG